MYILQNNQPSLFTTSLDEKIGTWGQVAISTATQEHFIKLSSGWCKVTDNMGIPMKEACQQPLPTKIKIVVGTDSYTLDIAKDGKAYIAANYALVKNSDNVKVLSRSGDSYNGVVEVVKNKLTSVQC